MIINDHHTKQTGTERLFFSEHTDSAYIYTVRAQALRERTTSLRHTKEVVLQPGDHKIVTFDFSAKEDVCLASVANVSDRSSNPGPVLPKSAARQP